MIRTIIAKELLQWRRDGRALGIAMLTALLVAVSLMTGGFAWLDQDRQRDSAQLKDDATFQRQGTKAPHAAAHFGRMAYKPVAPLAIFDPGATPYLGQVIWLEAHRRDPAMFRPAENSPELRRLADLSMAGVLTLFLPLLAFVAGHGAFAAERERGTLRQALSCGGATVRRLFYGKFAASAIACIAVSSIVTLVATFAAAAANGGESYADTILRGCALLLVYALYGVACTAIALLVSARARTAASALLILLSLWAVCVVIAPRAAASMAERLHATPEGALFWSTTANEIRERRRAARDSQKYRAIERAVVSAAIGREVSGDELSTLELNRQGLAFEVGERIEANTYHDAYRELHETYAAQARIRRLSAVLAPTIALQHVSSALAGTDVASHEHFSLSAERHRRLIIREINEDMMLHGAGMGFDYVADVELWARIPQFAYTPPPASLALRSAAWDGLALLAFAVIATMLARRAADRQSIA